MTPLPPFVEQHDFDDARDFRDHLMLSHPWWTDGHRRAWLFRGHADATWNLVPASQRPDGQTVLRSLLINASQKVRNPECAANDISAFDRGCSDPAWLIQNQAERTWHIMVQRKAESDAISEFAELANEIGLRIEGASVPSEKHGVPSIAAALAQHHGVPTRMLDWTRVPLVAAFFAASEHQSADSIAVWAIRQDVTGDTQPSTVICRYECPRHSHAYLHAQDGAFLYVGATLAANLMMRDGEWPCLVRAAEFLSDSASRPVFRVLRLPKKEVPRLNDILWYEGISRARLMPSFDSVQRTLTARWAQLATR